MASPYRLPTAVKELRGTADTRTTNAAEPVPTAEAPDCPDYVKGAAKREWTRICKELDAMGILASIDRALLTQYCLAWGEFDDAMRDIGKNGKILRLENGYEQIRPIVKERDKAEAKLFKLAVQFGFSPSARSKVKVPQKPKQLDAMTALLAKRSN